MIKTMATTRISAFSGDRLRKAREARGWSRGRLAIAIGTSTTSVAGWERGEKNPRPGLLYEIAKQLGDLDPAELLTLPRSEWGLAEHRVVHGWEQKDVAENPDLIPPISPSWLSQIEATYQRPTPAQVAGLAKLYDIPQSEVIAAWERARARALES